MNGRVLITGAAGALGRSVVRQFVAAGERILAVGDRQGGLAELAWLGAHVLMYPLGARTEALRVDPRVRPGTVSLGGRALFADDPLAARTPVLLVHGLVDNRSVFTVMQRNLRRRGFTHVYSWNYSPLSADVVRAARDLGEHIERICEQTGYERIHVVGHSLGGLIARYSVQRQGGDGRVVARRFSEAAAAYRAGGGSERATRAAGGRKTRQIVLARFAQGVLRGSTAQEATAAEQDARQLFSHAIFARCGL